MTSLKDLKAALEPLHAMIKKMEGDMKYVHEQYKDVAKLLSNISVKIDVFDQNTIGLLSNLSQMAAKKQTTKRTTKKKSDLQHQEPEDIVELDDIEEKTNSGEIISEELSQEEDNDEISIEETNNNELIPNTKSVIKPKASVKANPANPIKSINPETAKQKATVKSKSDVKPKTAAKQLAKPNKMNLFKSEYKINPSKFSQYISKEIIETATTNAAGNNNTFLSILYKHMNSTHPDVLEALKVK